MKDTYWEKNIPWSFADQKERPSVAERAAFRYALQDYMIPVIFGSDFQGKKVLEVGCGAGLDAITFAKLGASVWATDSSRLAVSEANKAVSESGLTKAIKVRKAEAHNIPYPDNSFDVVYSFGVLHHIIDPKPVLRELRRVLKPGGRVIAMLYNSESMMQAYSHRLMGLPYEMNGNPYTRPYSKVEAKKMFEGFFTDVLVTAHYNVIDTPKERKVKFWMVYGGEDLGWHLIVKGRKR